MNRFVHLHTIADIAKTIHIVPNDHDTTPSVSWWRFRKPRGENLVASGNSRHWKPRATEGDQRWLPSSNLCLQHFAMLRAILVSQRCLQVSGLRPSTQMMTRKVSLLATDNRAILYTLWCARFTVEEQHITADWFTWMLLASLYEPRSSLKGRMQPDE